ncbi:hypothetical protein GLYMA_09G063500v4 [Glycine max]|uniref:cytokinin dehydrogenase n=1 Tax=Glycine max TaxID=3847 RepID=K7LC49_SOYBN|nr:hypothetical protein GYH30_024221 [Glycine max]KRH37399.1 hypothetical protein GLYMA_09G063500v4 [Glycine max]|eukprot:XP_014617455.1 cytokinin dehydrogenase 3 isoform X2 [Glycine max]
MPQRNLVLFSTTMVVLLLSSIVLTQAQPRSWSAFQASKELATKLSRNPQTFPHASTDYGHIVHKTPVAIFNPSSVSDILALIHFSNSLPNPFPIAPRGKAHSVHGQAMTKDGVVLNMTNLNSSFQNGLGVLVSACDGKGPLICYADVGGGQMWIDVLHASLERGLTPLSLTDYMYATVGGTLSNAGMGGMSFRFGPQISNVLELDVITGKGDLVTCSKEQNSEAFYAALGGLGQFGVITRARIPLGPAPTRVKWLRLLYNNFTAFSRDQEHLISFSERNDIATADYVEGMLLLNQPPLDLLFYPASDHQREVAYLLKGLNFVHTFVFERDVSYEEFVNRVYPLEQMLRSEGLWEVPHPWLNLWVPRSRISDFDEGVFKDIVLKQNITGGSFLVYPTNRRNKWDDRMTPITPDEDVFYVVDFLRVAKTFDVVDKLQVQNKQILRFCNDAGIKITEYLIGNKTHQQWVEHFGPKWKLFADRKTEFDPKKILSPGHGIFQ